MSPHLNLEAGLGISVRQALEKEAGVSLGEGMQAEDGLAAIK